MNAKEMRARALAYKTKTRSDESVMFEGVAYFMLTPSVEMRGALLKRAGVGNDGDLEKVDLTAAQVRSVLELTCDADGVRVFEDADVEVLLASPAGGIVDALGPAATKALYPPPKDVAKNSEAMASVELSSPSPSA